MHISLIWTSVLICIFPIVSVGMTLKTAMISDSTLVNAFFDKIPTVEDTIRFQLGGKLFFIDEVDISSDSITVLHTDHYVHNDSLKDSVYKFIVHNKESKFYERFMPQKLESDYEAYFKMSRDKEGRIMPQSFGDEYYKILRDEQEKVDGLNLNPALEKYSGYWIYLTLYDNKYYIKDEWGGGIASFRIVDRVFDYLYMDGPYPKLINDFEVYDNGDFKVRFTDESEYLFELVDHKLKVYKCNGRFAVKADRANKFELIEYANRSGNLFIDSEDFVTPSE